MEQCDICEKPATVKAWGGECIRKATKYGHDIPDPKNFTYRCKEHEYKPDAGFGQLWLWCSNQERWNQ